MLVAECGLLRNADMPICLCSLFVPVFFTWNILMICWWPVDDWVLIWWMMRYHPQRVLHWTQRCNRMQYKSNKSIKRLWMNCFWRYHRNVILGALFGYHRAASGIIRYHRVGARACARLYVNGKYGGFRLTYVGFSPKPSWTWVPTCRSCSYRTLFDKDNEQ